MWIYFSFSVAENIMGSFNKFIDESKEDSLVLQIKSYWITAMPIS